MNPDAEICLWQGGKHDLTMHCWACTLVAHLVSKTHEPSCLLTLSCEGKECISQAYPIDCGPSTPVHHLMILSSILAEADCHLCDLGHIGNGIAAGLSVPHPAGESNALLLQVMPLYAVPSAQQHQILNLVC